MNSTTRKSIQELEWPKIGSRGNKLLLALIVGVSVSFVSGCQTTRPWFAQMFGTPVSRSTEPRPPRAGTENEFASTETLAHNKQQANPGQERSLDYRMANGSMQDTARQQNELLQASFQEVQNPAPTTGGQSPQTMSAGALQQNASQHPSTSQQQHAVPENRNQGFFPREFAPASPRSATEMVVEMAAEIRLMREELGSLKATVDFVRHENAELQRQRDDLVRRVANLELQLSLTRNAEQEMTSRFEALQRYLNEFSRSRQQQIKDLTAIVDLLEQEVRKNQ